MAYDFYCPALTMKPAFPSNCFLYLSYSKPNHFLGFDMEMYCTHTVPLVEVFADLPWHHSRWSGLGTSNGVNEPCQGKRVQVKSSMAEDGKVT